MRARGAVGLALAASLALGPPLCADEASDPTLEIVEVRDEGPELLVSFRVAGAFDLELIERIEAGMTVAFEHRVDLLSKRPVPLMPPRLLSRTVVETTARYDTLTRQYYLERRTLQKAEEGSSEGAPAAQTAVTPERSEMEAWMTAVSGVPLSGPPTAGTFRNLRVRIRTQLGRHYRLLILPFNESAEAEQLLRP